MTHSKGNVGAPRHGNDATFVTMSTGKAAFNQLWKLILEKHLGGVDRMPDTGAIGDGHRTYFANVENHSWSLCDRL